MKTPVICTIIAKNYLAQARCLVDSFRQYHPDGQAFVLVVDTLEGYFDPAKENFTTVPINKLDIPELPEMVSRYTIAELCTAVKPFFLQYLFRTYQLSRLCYFDPDIYVYAPLHEIWKKLATHPVILTPHLLEPVDENRVPNEFTILQSGIFNLGFIGLRRTPATDSFLHWWRERLIHYGYNAPERMQHYDQRWVDFVPGFIDDVLIERNPSVNTAYWDLGNRQLTFSGGKFFVNGQPLIFFHFSGYTPDRPDSISRYQNRFTFADLPMLKPLFDDYALQLRRHGYDTIKKWPIDAQRDLGAAFSRIQRRKTRTLTGFQGFRPRAYRRFTQLLARCGLEKPLTRLLGERGVSQIRALVIPTFRPAAPSFSFTNKRGLNLVGFFEHDGSIGEIARRTAAGLQEKQYSFNRISVDVSNMKPKGSSRPVHNYFRVNLIHANADVLPMVLRQLPKQLVLQSHTIAYWAWELPTLPKVWEDRLAMINEVWVCSHFVKRAVASVAPIPVRVIGAPVEVAAVSPTLHRLRGLPEDKFIFLYIFDLESYQERKNPHGVIEAFRLAFGPKPQRERLVIKVQHAQRFPKVMHSLRGALKNVAGILIDETFSHQHMAALLHLCDAYVSLHRAEGFGLTIAEAMVCGKPVITVPYSGPADYVTEANSFLVRFELTQLEHDIGPYQAGQVWAEPDVEHAAQVMRFVVQNPTEAQQRGKQAQQDIQRRYSTEVFTRKIIEHLSRRKLPIPVAFGTDRPYTEVLPVPPPE